MLATLAALTVLLIVFMALLCAERDFRRSVAAQRDRLQGEVVVLDSVLQAVRAELDRTRAELKALRGTNQRAE